MKHYFQKFAQRTIALAGSYWAFIAALILVTLWLVMGPIFHFTDTWQLVMNTISSVVTLLLAFLIQNAQNRDTKALQIKMDEIIATLQGAHNAMINIQDLSDDQLMQIENDLRRLAREHSDSTDSISDALSETRGTNLEGKNNDGNPSEPTPPEPDH